MDAIDWEKIHSFNWVNEPDCWTKCGDGFCCSNSRPEYGFRFLPQGFNTIIYFKEEFEWLESKGMTAGVVVKPLNLFIDGVTILELYQADCHYNGLCKGHIERPFLCKIYPFIPVISENNKISELLPASLFDMTAEAVSHSIPCVVRGNKDQQIMQWNNSEELLAILNHPKLKFYLTVTNILIKSYQDKVSSWFKTSGVNQLNFWKKWETEFFKKSFSPVSRDIEALIRKL